MALAGVSGMLIGTLFPFTVLSGDGYQLKGFVVTVLGGFGNPVGALLGGVALGLLEGAVTPFVPVSWTLVIEFALFVAGADRIPRRRFRVAARSLVMPCCAPAVLLDHHAGRSPRSCSFRRIGDNVELRESLALATVYITLASNLNLMLGYAGYINFGSIVFFGLGGYICVWLVKRIIGRWRRACSPPASASARSPSSSGSASCACAARSSRSPPSASSKAVQAFVAEFRAVGRLGRHLPLARKYLRRSAVRRTRCG